MPKLPVLSGKQLIKALEKCNYRVVRQKGNHIRLLPPTNTLQRPITVPLHKTIKPGLLSKIIRDANLLVEGLRNLL